MSLCLFLVLFLVVGVPRTAPKILADPPTDPSVTQGECIGTPGAPAGTCSSRLGAEQQGQGEVGTGGTYIVRFKEYKMAEEHRERLHLALAGRDLVWRWLHRNNPASRYPTDFGLVQLSEPAATAKEQLAQLSFIKDVHPDRRLLHSLLESAPSGTQTSVAASSSGPDGEYAAHKRPGRMQTRPTFDLEDNIGLEDSFLDLAELSHRVGNDSAVQRRNLLAAGQTLPVLLEADKLWEQGFKGQRVKMGVFDTGIRGDHPHVKNIRERTNWTHEPTLEDGLGHGSFVAGVIASSDAACPGLAPEVELYTFRVFTNDQVSYTSWFLDAFNYAIASQMDVVNLSIGGPDFLDEPFVEKVGEITSNGILMVSAIGNDGPLYGTLNNPADQNDVIGVGGIDFSGRIASFSSRGMSTWELPLGYGRSKPDVMAFGRDVQGSRINGGCRSLSGTSVASPVVAGAVCLLVSVIPEEKRWEILNPASMKQALVEGATPLPELNMYEQGQGKINVLASKDILASYKPRASVIPAKLDLTDCPYMWPFCKQPMYASAMPTMFNATVLNGMGLTGKFKAAPVYTPTDAGGKLLDFDFEWSDMLWPWSGYLAMYITVKPEGAAFNGTAAGEISFTIVSPPSLGQKDPQHSKVTLPFTAAIIPTPPRQKRVLWDQFHSIRYPPAYFPRDDLQVRHDILDWHGDHPHTNFHDMYDHMRANGYFLEVLASPLTCFNASQYGALMIVDSEDEFYQEEISKLENDVKHLGLGLLVFAEWYDEDTLLKLRFYDDNTRSWWEAATGGANVPALNDLLAPYGAAFGSGVLDGSVQVPGSEGFKMASGTRIAAFPPGGHLYWSMLAAKQGSVRGQSQEEPVLGLLSHGAGKVAMYGDSNCLDSSHQRSSCYDLLRSLLQFATEGGTELLTVDAHLTEPFGSFDKLPQRRQDYNFTDASPVLMNPLTCYANAPKAFRGMNFSQWSINVSRPVFQVADSTEPQAAGVEPPKPALPAGMSTTALSAEGGKGAGAAQEQQPGNGSASGQAGNGGATAGDAGGSGGAAATQQQQQQQQVQAGQEAKQQGGVDAQAGAVLPGEQAGTAQSATEAKTPMTTGPQVLEMAGLGDGSIPSDHPQEPVSGLEMDSAAAAAALVSEAAGIQVTNDSGSSSGSGGGEGQQQEQEQHKEEEVPLEEQKREAVPLARQQGVPLGDGRLQAAPGGTIMNISLLFAFLGAVAVAGLWSMKRRRRTGGVLLLQSPRRPQRYGWLAGGRAVPRSI